MYGESDVETTGGLKKKRSTIALAAAGALGASAIAGAVTGAHFGQKLGFAGGLGVSKAIYLKRNKRSADGEEFALSEGMETINGVETIESGDLAAVSPEAEMPEGEEGNKGEAAAADGSVRKERSLTAVGLGALGAAHLAGAVVGGHIGKKFGFGTGLAVGLGAKKHVLNKKDKSVHVKKAHHHAHKKPVHHAHKKPHYKTEQVCKHVPIKQCTSNQVCKQVPREKCQSLPVKTCKQTPNTKCSTTPHEVCTMVTDTKCKNVPHETCQQVPKQRCVSVPRPVCVNVSIEYL